jgi:hypothetical protein
MALAVALQTERGEVIERVIDVEGALSRLLPNPDNRGYHLLCGIDRYGDTVFNRVQAPLFLSEWRKIEAGAASDYERQLCVSIKQLVLTMQDGVHLYVRFIGD